MLSRRAFVRSGLAGATAVSFGAAYWRNALAGAPARKGTGPYGPLRDPDANGIMLPDGFRSRVIARGMQPVAGTGYVFPYFPDGAATFPTPDGGWILAVNSEVPSIGGASGIRFAADGTVTDAYRILENTSTNCAGGPTPWGTWLSCEEVDKGLVWECDPTGATPAVARPALGAFKHEAACVDPQRQHVYLSEDVNGGGLYRFVPSAYPDLSAGRLEVACDGGGDRVTWTPVPDPSGQDAPTRAQVPGMLGFARGEGIWFDSGTVYLATTSDETVHAYDTVAARIEIIYRAADVEGTPLRGVDNLHVSRSGDLFVAEDSYTNDPDAMDVCIISPDREVSRFLKLTGAEHHLPDAAESETVGLCFDPSGTRLYLGSQRGAFGPGIVYEVTGPFRQSRSVPPAPGVPIGLDVARRGRFGRRLPVGITLDGRSTVVARLSARGRTLARVTRTLGPGAHMLRLRPRRHHIRGKVRARLEVRVTTPGNPDRIIRRKVTLR